MRFALVCRLSAPSMVVDGNTIITSMTSINIMAMIIVIVFTIIIIIIISIMVIIISTMVGNTTDIMSNVSTIRISTPQYCHYE